MKQFLLFILLLNTIVIYAQKEANQWYMEERNAIDFNHDTIRYLAGSVLGKNESTSSISDFNGQMMFYSNGITLYNKYHQVVKNGKDLGFPINPNETTSKQGALLLKHVDNDSLIYLFSTDFQGKSGGLVYAVIDINGNNDSGEVISKKNKLTGAVDEAISAVNHHNGRDIWICVHGYGNSIFHLFLLTKNGIQNCPKNIDVGFNHSEYSGSGAQNSLRFSTNSKYIVHSNYLNGELEINFFDNLNGLIYNQFYFKNDAYPISFDFSNNHQFLYYTNLLSFNQLNLNTQSVKLLYHDTIPAQFNIANDNKIYGAMNNTKDLLVIENPNEEGFNCNLKIKKNFFINKGGTSVPNFNRSYFYIPNINYSYEMNCTKNSVQFWGKDTFGANSHVWQVRKSFGVNGYLLMGSTKDINYTFADTGTYEVRYVASNGNKADTVIKSIVLYDKIKQGFLGKDTTYVQGDVINKTLFAPTPNHCVRWYFDKLSTGSFKEKGSSSSLLADSVGTYICKVTNQAFCEVWDTIVISECINNLNQPSLFRSRDTLRTFHLNADSFVWYINNEVYKITKQPFLALTDTGTYRVEAAKKGHCNSSSIGTNYVQRLNVNRINIEDLGIRVFPNPSNGNVSIQSQNPFKLKINTVLGQTIYERENINNIHLPKGVYFLHFEVGGFRSVEKVVVW